MECPALAREAAFLAGLASCRAWPPISCFPFALRVAIILNELKDLKQLETHCICRVDKRSFYVQY
jgi:hypothetical protein